LLGRADAAIAAAHRRGLRPDCIVGTIAAMHSARLSYAPVTLGDAGRFHRIACDEHVRRYLLDGVVVSMEWSAQRIDESQASFARRGVGLWLAHERSSNELVGFCGFIGLPSIHVEPQLAYALFERFTGMGYATEMARASVRHACTQARFRDVFASVDAANVASRRVLEKLGFEPIAGNQGTFGATSLLRLYATEGAHDRCA